MLNVVLADIHGAKQYEHHSSDRSFIQDAAIAESKIIFLWFYVFPNSLTLSFHVTYEFCEHDK